MDKVSKRELRTWGSGPTYDEDGENILLRGQLSKKVDLGEAMIRNFERLVTEGELDNCIAEKLDNVFEEERKNFRQ